MAGSSLALLERTLTTLRAHTATLQKPEPIPVAVAAPRIRRAPQPRSEHTKRKKAHAESLLGQYTGAVAMHEDGARCNVRVTAEAVGPLGGLIVRLEGPLNIACGTAQMSAKTFEALKTQPVYEAEIWLNGHSGWVLTK